MKKNQQVLSILLIFFIILVMLGTSYAYYERGMRGEKKYLITVGNLKIKLDESKSKNITIQNAIPVSDREGMRNDSYKFALINDEERALDYTIYLKEEETENKTPSSAIRYHYTRDVEDIKETKNITEQQDSSGRYYLETGSIPARTTYQYTFQMWIDEKAGNGIMGTEYSVRLEIEASQTTRIYKEEILNGTDPVLSDNLVPVTIEDNGEVRKADVYEEWYKYSEQKWANAVVLEDKTKEYNNKEIIPSENIQSYFVWIPRYKYKLFNMGNYTSLTTIEDRVQTIDVIFENKEISPSVGTKVGDYHSHPAFQAFDSNGFWVGKFESGYKEATSTTEAEQNNNSSANLIIKPNAYSWRSITVGNAFKVSYDYLRSDESHMTKNTEWGAVAYLQHSIYGSRTNVRNNNNSTYMTGYASVEEPTCGNSASTDCNLSGTDETVTSLYNTTIGYLASTTANISGVYDMSGGAWEYVMGYNLNASVDSSDITSLYSDFFTNSNWSKYYDQYYNNTSNDDYSKRILGDTTGEMGPFQTIKEPNGSYWYRCSWYGDYSWFITDKQPWMEKSGQWSNGVGAGIFATTRYTGNKSSDSSFRVVLTPQD